MSKLKNIWANAELRTRLLMTILLLVIFRLGCSVPVPYVAPTFLDSIFSSGNILSYMNVLSGNALSQCAMFALGVGPYINASIIIQLLTYAIPQLKDISKMENGNKEIEKYTRMLTIIISVIMSLGYVHLLNINSALTTESLFARAILIVCFVAGSQACMFIGNMIDEIGIGNGVSLLIFAGIIAGWGEISNLISTVNIFAQFGYWWYYIIGAGILLVTLLSLVYTVYVDGSIKKVPITYSTNTNSALPANRNTHLPMKLIMTGVLPIIFAVTILQVPSTIAMVAGEKSKIYEILSGFNEYSWLYMIVYALLIFAFNYFYTSVQFNPTEVANNLRTSGATIPGIRPGESTVTYLKKSVKKLTIAGSIALSLIAIVPLIVGRFTGLAVPFAGSSLLIVTGVALECIEKINSYMTARTSGSFLKRNKRRAR